MSIHPGATILAARVDGLPARRGLKISYRRNAPGPKLPSPVISVVMPR